MADRAVVAFDIGILLRFSGLDILDFDPVFPGPLQKLPADIFRTIINPNAIRLASPFDDLVEPPDDTFSRKREVNVNCQAFSVKIIQYVQKTERVPITRKTRENVSTTVPPADGGLMMSKISDNLRLV